MIKALTEKSSKSERDATAGKHIFRALRRRDRKDFHVPSPEGRVFLQQHL